MVDKYSENEIVNLLNDTSRLAASKQINQIEIVATIAVAVNDYENFTRELRDLDREYQVLKVKDKMVTRELKNLYDTI